MITSLTNPKVKALCKLSKHKKRQNEYLIYGSDIILKAISNNQVNELIKTSDSELSYVKEMLVTKEVMHKICGRDDVSEIAVCKVFNNQICNYQKVVLLDDLADPSNIGMIIKACALFGYDTIFLNVNCADIYNIKCIKEAGVSFYDINLIQMDFDILINKLKDEGFIIYATGLKDNTYNLYETKAFNKMAIIMGNEGRGVKDRYFTLADYIIKIPMENIDSLNVAVASSIVLEYYNNTSK